VYSTILSRDSRNRQRVTRNSSQRAEDKKCHVTRPPKEKTPEAFRQWLRELRAQKQISHDDLAEAVGASARRQTIRWLKEGTEPGGIALLMILSALGVRLEPSPPEELPGALNAELNALRRELRELRTGLQQPAEPASYVVFEASLAWLREHGAPPALRSQVEGLADEAQARAGQLEDLARELRAVVARGDVQGAEG
jgi:transcriptional regulator with XRE-family HTH domain